MNFADRASSLFWLSLSLWVMLISRRLGLGDYHNPGPGFIFFWSALFLSVLSLLLFSLSFRRRRAPESESEVFPLNFRPVILIAGAMVVYTLILNRVGFLLSTFLFVAFLLAAIGRKKWHLVIFVAVLTAVSAYFIFQVWLQAQLPKGLLGL